MSTRVLTLEKKKQLYKALENGVSIRFAAALIGVGKTTVYKQMEVDPVFGTEVRIAQAIAVEGLVAQVRKSKGGAWKLLKNLGKEDYKDHHEVTNLNPEPIKIVVEDYRVEEDSK